MADGSFSVTGHDLPTGDTSVTGREHGDVLACDERCYVNIWTSLLQMELAAEQGPIDDTDSDVAMEDGRAVSNAVLDVQYRMRPRAV